jgi:hypothetical protein
MKKISLYSLILFAVISCRPKYKSSLVEEIFNDYETSLAFNQNNDSNFVKQIGSNYAFSGKFYNQLNGDNVKGIVFEMSLNNISTERISLCSISAKCRTSSESLKKVNLVCEVYDENSKLIKWQGVTLDNRVPANEQWTTVDQTFTIFDYTGLPTNKIIVLFWIEDRSINFDIDDFHLKFH